MAKHKHYDAIIAYANGAAIQYRSRRAVVNMLVNFWEDIAHPTWQEACEYRVKPSDRFTYEALMCMMRDDDCITGLARNTLLDIQDAIIAKYIAAHKGETL